MNTWTREPPRLIGPALFKHARIGRQISSVERPLAENLPELIGKFDRGDIGVVQRSSAEKRGQRHVAEKPVSREPTVHPPTGICFDTSRVALPGFAARAKNPAAWTGATGRGPGAYFGQGGNPGRPHASAAGLCSATPGGFACNGCGAIAAGC